VEVQAVVPKLVFQRKKKTFCRLDPPQSPINNWVQEIYKVYFAGVKPCIPQAL
jgi:hypothetical protein